jgi:hypothetical protein
MSYQEEVRQAAAALIRSEDGNWLLARLTYRNTFIGKGNHIGQVAAGKVPMERWCSDIRAASGRRFSRSTGRNYRLIWARFGRKYIQGKISWVEACDQVRGDNSRERLFNLRLNHNLKNATPEAKREAYAQLARDPDVISLAMGVPHIKRVKVPVPAQADSVYRTMVQNLPKRTPGAELQRQLGLPITSVRESVAYLRDNDRTGSRVVVSNRKGYLPTNDPADIREYCKRMLNTADTYIDRQLIQTLVIVRRSFPEITEASLAIAALREALRLMDITREELEKEEPSSQASVVSP